MHTRAKDTVAICNCTKHVEEEAYWGVCTPPAALTSLVLGPDPTPSLGALLHVRAPPPLLPTSLCPRLRSPSQILPKEALTVRLCPLQLPNG